MNIHSDHAYSSFQGNVEYKLKLTNVTAVRFARLVTQLKWRLLEGGGQAYYELGVADSGALIGLPRADLEESLETLEMMAGEIGASSRSREDSQRLSAGPWPLLNLRVASGIQAVR